MQNADWTVNIVVQIQRNIAEYIETYTDSALL